MILAPFLFPPFAFTALLPSPAFPGFVTAVLPPLIRFAVQAIPIVTPGHGGKRTDP
jgi:hypothetical protein